MSTTLIQNAIRIGETRSQRLFDQQIDTRGQQRLRSRGMMHRRHTDRRGIERPYRSQTSLDRLESRNAKLSRSLSRNRTVTIDHSSKLNCFAGLFQLTIDAKMVAPEGSRSNNSDPEWTRRRHYFFSTGASTA
jgi:hypothetical protein